MNFKKRLLLFFLLIYILFPYLVFAYSDRVILGGDNIGIRVNTMKVMIVGFYKVDEKYIGKDAGLEVGDLITKINNIDISSIDDMISIINNNTDKSNLNITFIRNNKELNTVLPLVKSNNVYRTGLYVKDQINGIGTLTYIDPSTKIYGALGHEISDKNSYKKVDIKDGNIYKSEITGITPSKDGEPGSKEAKIYSDISYGLIKSNTYKGVFGKITDNELLNDNYIDVASLNDIKLGNAKIRTVLYDNQVDEYDINIIDIDKYDDTKNILFEIIDKDLLDITGGVVAGMSGSPIIQNNKIIGAVTHVVVNDTSKGYGIFITKMLEEGDKIE